MSGSEPSPRRPLIGITTYARNEEGEFHIPGEYVDAVARAGGAALLIPPVAPACLDVAARVDGIILAGGGDIDPHHYGGESHDKLYMIDGERDTGELELARYLIESSKPSLAICRGMQIVNVALGGTLHPHLPDVVGQRVRHRLPPRNPVPHEITIQPRTRLAGVLQTVTCEAQSWHHQAIRDAGRGIQIVAVAPDEVVEAIEVAEHRWFVGVQWHPELTAATDPIQQRLFAALVEATGLACGGVK